MDIKNTKFSKVTWEPSASSGSSPETDQMVNAAFNKGVAANEKKLAAHDRMVEELMNSAEKNLKGRAKAY